MKTAALTLLLATVAAHAQPSPATIREELCRDSYRGPYWNGGATEHALRCALSARAGASFRPSRFTAREWILTLRSGGGLLPPVTPDGLKVYESRFRTREACDAAAAVWQQSSYEAVCKPRGQQGK